MLRNVNKGLHFTTKSKNNPLNRHNN